MFVRRYRYAVALFVSVVIGASVAVAVQSSTQANATDGTTETTKTTHARFERWATITKLPNGYYYDAGQQNTHLVVTRVDHGIRFADRRTDVLRHKPESCNRKHARVGTVVVCRVPGSVSERNPMTVKVFTRLGDDYANTSALPPAFKLYGLADKGRDVFVGGPGNDFINGAQNRDRIWGGGGRDWLRGNLGDDDLYGGPGNDRLVGVYNHDVIRGGSGNDRVGGGPANDHLFGGPGSDWFLCGPGRDRGRAERGDRIAGDCEAVRVG